MGLGRWWDGEGGWAGGCVAVGRYFEVCVYQRNGMGKSALLSWTVFGGKGRARWLEMLCLERGREEGSFDVVLLVNES